MQIVVAELGAKRVDVSQNGDEPFVVLADPEGNEFCLIRGDPTRPGALVRRVRPLMTEPKSTTSGWSSSVTLAG